MARKKRTPAQVIDKLSEAGAAIAGGSASASCYNGNGKGIIGEDRIHTQ